LAYGRVKESINSFGRQQSPICRDINGYVPFGAVADEIGEQRMGQGFAHEMKADLLSEWGNLIKRPYEKIRPHDVLFPIDFRTKIAMEIADIADFDVNLFEALL
jgi:hypothetical protein